MGGPPLSIIPKILYAQIFTKLPHPEQDFSGKTVIVTGSNVGLGFEAAKHIARLGASKLILAVRTVSKGETAKQEILKAAPKVSPDTIEVWPLDLTSYKSIQDFCDRAQKDLPRLDVVLANAGVLTTKYQTAEDNEETITVNVISRFLMAGMLLPKMRETATAFNTRPTMAFVNSLVHFFTKMPEKSAPDGQIFNVLNDKSKANMSDRYPLSKLLEVLVIREIVERKPDDTVTLNFVNPALCKSDLFRSTSNPAVALQLKLMARTTEEGSRTLVHAAGSGKNTHGQYLTECAIEPPAPFVTSDIGRKTQKRVYDEVAAKLEKIRPGVTAGL